MMSTLPTILRFKGQLYRLAGETGMGSTRPSAKTLAARDYGCDARALIYDENRDKYTLKLLFRWPGAKHPIVSDLSWELTPEEAREVQELLGGDKAGQPDLAALPEPVKMLAAQTETPPVERTVQARVTLVRRGS